MRDTATTVWRPETAPGAAHKAKAATVFAKHPDHWYVEPQDCTAALLEMERFTPVVWDPCCGGGNVPMALKAAGYTALGSDIEYRLKGRPSEGAFPWERMDFLDESRPVPAPHVEIAEGGAFSIVSNPPYKGSKGTVDFVKRALRMPGLVKLAVFVEVRFLGSETRATGFFQDYPPSACWIVVPRPSCPPGDFLEAGGKAEGGNADFCWLVYDNLNPATANAMITGWVTRPGLDKAAARR